MTASLAISPADSATRLCPGVPAYARGGQARISCGDELGPQQRVVCPRCNAEIERRQEVERLRQATDGRRRVIEATGVSTPFVTGAKSLDSVQILTPDHGAAIAAVRRWIGWTPDHGSTLGVLIRGD